MTCFDYSGSKRSLAGTLHRTQVRLLESDGSRDGGFESLKYGWLYLPGNTDVLDLIESAEGYRVDCNTIRLRAALS